MRMYKYHELKGNQQLVFETDKKYWERKYLFEAYLYCIFAQNLTIKEREYKNEFSKLGVSKRVFKYTDKDISLFLKYYYKDNYEFNKLSYERFVKTKNNS